LSNKNYDITYVKNEKVCEVLYSLTHALLVYNTVQARSLNSEVFLSL